MRTRLRDIFPFVMIAVGIIFVLGTMTWAIIYDHKHPCLRYGPTYQTWFQPPPVYVGTPGKPDYFPIQQPGYYVEERDCLERRQ